ncbi:exosortase F system-associated membrane protein [Flavobacterium pallidum]|uniref:Exosortase F system-associated protein n=1 Tax=Flavobacterium pallidum TaxID=2172098 RepID=A0A2S1SE03_9FLAO|nr:exosortase F system-associated protein [Flavobacterium pallidum]AWI24619.1 exosortase F system-associated protein [Flavobacterium pallidum]
MLKKLLAHKLRALAFIGLVCLLALVRIFETKLFYDPFLRFFKSEFTGKPLPGFDVARLSFSLFFRYLLNTIISLALIYVAFKEKGLVKFSALLYLIFFLVLMMTFFVIVYGFGTNSTLELFYVRRFLIQPIFVILFIPAFYYQEHVAKK